MKATTVLSLALMFSLGFTAAPLLSHASEVSGQISSGDSSAPSSGSGSEVGGTFGGGDSGSNTNGTGGSGGGGGSGSLSGTVSGGLGSTGGSGGDGGSVLSVSTANNNEAENANQETVTPGEVLGIFTSAPNFPNERQDLSSEEQRILALNTADGSRPIDNSSLTAAVITNGIELSWWFWLFVILLLITIGLFTYRHYQKENR